MISRNAITSGVFRIKKQLGEIFWLSESSSNGTASHLLAEVELVIVGYAEEIRQKAQGMGKADSTSSGESDIFV
jgi:hypothetical protein